MGLSWLQQRAVIKTSLLVNPARDRATPAVANYPSKIQPKVLLDVIPSQCHNPNLIDSVIQEDTEG